MKKTFFTLSIFILSVFVSFANEPMSLEDQKLDQEFAKLDKIEAYVQNNEGTTLADLNAEKSSLVADANINSTNSSSFLADDLPANIPPFVWGCVLGIIGVLIVYLVSDKDNAMTKKALIGCLVQGVAWVVYYFVVLGAVTRAVI